MGDPALMDDGARVALVTISTYRLIFIYFTQCTDTGVIVTHALSFYRPLVTIPTVTLTRKVGPGLQDLQTRAQRILAEGNAQKAEENTWIGRMVAAENINDMKALIKSRDSV